MLVYPYLCKNLVFCLALRPILAKLDMDGGASAQQLIHLGIRELESPLGGRKALIIGQGTRLIGVRKSQSEANCDINNADIADETM